MYLTKEHCKGFDTYKVSSLILIEQQKVIKNNIFKFFTEYTLKKKQIFIFYLNRSAFNNFYVLLK